MTKPVIKIDVVSDVVCPWCYIGKRRLEKAIDQLGGAYDFDITYHPFELNPDMPASGKNQKKYLSDKFGGEDRYDQITNQTTRVAAQEGLAFDFNKQAVSPNTRKAHSIVQFAKTEGKQLETVEALFKAYFSDGIDLSNDENLVTVAVAAGLDEAKVRTLLQHESALVQIALEEQEMYKLGISGVPFYIINNKYGVSGAQAPETFVNAFQQIGKEVASGEACDVDAKNC